MSGVSSVSRIDNKTSNNNDGEQIVEVGKPIGPDGQGILIENLDMASLLAKLDELIDVQKRTLNLLCAAFEDSLSGGDISNGDF